jgi:hypothetical protein
MMEMIKRDTKNMLDGMLVAINANDRLNRNMQHNVIPVASAKNMAIIGMKVFADGAMYSKEPHWTQGPHEVVRTVGSKEMPSRPLIEYALTTPGIHNAIIGIGQISEDKKACQMEQNLLAAQIKPDGLSAGDRLEVEKMTAEVKAGKTNYFQVTDRDLTAPGNINLKKGDQNVVVQWDSAYAGSYPIEKYEIFRNGSKIGALDHKPQTTTDPFSFIDAAKPKENTVYKVVAIDRSGQKASTQIKL